MANYVPLVIPAYRIDLSESELKRIQISLSHNNYGIFLLPESIVKDFRRVHKFDCEVVSFPDYWFTSRNSYSSLFLQSFFWERFKSFDYIAVCQTDAIALKNLEPLLRLNYCYVGSSWSKKKCRLLNGKIYEDYRKYFFLPYQSISVGNGGLSLRHVKSSLEAISIMMKIARWYKLTSGETNEDLVFSYVFKKYHFPLPSSKQADKIFLETKAADLDDIPDVYGFHALGRFNPSLERKILLNYESFMRE